MRVLNDAVWPHIRGILYHNYTESHVLETLYQNILQCWEPLITKSALIFYS